MSVLTDEKLTEQLAELLGVPHDEAERILQSTVGLFRDSLLKGHQLDLVDFLSLQVIEERARIVQFADSPRRMIEPPRNTLVTRPLPAFEAELTKVRLTPILLVVPQNDFFAQIVEYHFAQAGWNVELAHDPSKVFADPGGRGGLLVILDSALPGAQELLHQLKVRRATNTVPTVALFPRGQGSHRPDGLRIQADQELVEPFEVAELLACAERELVRSAEEELLFDQQVQVVLPSTQADLDRATYLVRDLLVDSGLDDERQTAFHAAVREAIGNAVQHGGRFDPARMVYLQYLVDPNRVTVIVRDEGTGFDHRRFLAPTAHKDAVQAARARHAQGGRGGLGILMMSRAADRVEYNDRGTVVTLSKLLRPQPAPAPAPTLSDEVMALTDELEDLELEVDDLCLETIDHQL